MGIISVFTQPQNAKANNCMERLQKIMAHAGIDSRRHCEDLIRQGRVKVNGKVVTKIPVLVDPEKDIITIGRKRLKY